MKLTELFSDDKVNPDIEVRKDETSYRETMHVGNTEYFFHAYTSPLFKRRRQRLGITSDYAWELEFAMAEQAEGIGFGATKRIKFDATGTGNEFKVFEFVVQAAKNFVKLYDPDVMVFTTKSEDVSRNRLYQHLLKRLISKYEIIKEEDGGSIDYWLIKHGTRITEGKMKRSDPYISGDLPGPRPTPVTAKSKYDQKILNLATKAGKSPEHVEQLWHDTKKTVDLSMPNAYAIIMAKVQRSLGLRESLIAEENFKHIVNEYGELTYGWKTDLEDEEFEGYIPKGYSKKVLELGGIFAAEPGRGQGDKLMKLFLDSPEAKKAELIFLDPVPGLGANFKSPMSDTQQIRRLQAFYRRYGFRNRPGANRMWLVKKGSIPDEKLPT